MSNVSMLEIPQEILDSAQATPDDLKTELAVSLYAQGRLSIGKARELANMSLWEFRQVIGFRKISPHYGEEELQEDVAVLNKLEKS